MIPHRTGRRWLIWAAFIFAGSCSIAAQAFAGDTSPLEDVLKRLEKSKSLEIKGSDNTKQILGRTEADVRRQKEEAAKSLKNTLREQDERNQTRAIEAGKAIIVE